MITLKTNICTDFESARSREWLETNGIGGFASGTVAGANSRRYHGLLTAALRPPLGRVVTLSKFEEVLHIGDKTFELSSNQYPQLVHPKGFKFIKSFRLEPFPVWIYRVGGIRLEKKIFMVHGENTTVCQWTVLDKPDDAEVSLELKPLVAFRDYHYLGPNKIGFDESFEMSDSTVSIKPHEEFPALFFAHNAIAVDKTGHWYRDFEYEIEKERGFDFREDLFQPFSLVFDLGEPAGVVVSTEIESAYEIPTLEARELARREDLIIQSENKGDFGAQLALAADQFIVTRGDGKTIIAGYPWFSDWGRDTMIALPGLTLTTGRADIARQILLEFSRHFSDGMIPNRFPDVGETPEYNTVDATLWYFEAVRAYVAKTNDEKFVRDHVYAKLAESVAWHVRGTRYGIGVDSDGLLAAGVEGSQLTWMDAKVGDRVFTPRIGKPVEIQALWYNALLIMADFAQRFGDEVDRVRYETMADAARTSFTEKFWNDEEQCLYDLVTPDGRDASIRPNQIFAVSLPHSMLSIGRAVMVVKKVENELLTPYGLRSLSPRDPQYRSIYIGSPLERDSSYHQGTVWAWPIGAFVDAYRRVHPNGHQTDERIVEVLTGFMKHLSDAGLGQISEIFDGDAPHTPRGCPAQAWSIAEVLRVL